MPFLTSNELLAVQRLLWPAGSDTSDDAQRWRQQHFELPCLTAGSPQTSFPLGLQQSHGGPCGVLAAVQAELLRLALFGRRAGSHDQERRSGGDKGAADDDALQQLVAQLTREGEDAQLELLAEALVSVLVRCSRREDDDSTPASQRFAVHLVTRSDANLQDTGANEAYCEQVVRATGARDPALLCAVRERLDAFRAPHGVMNFVLSVVRSKGVAAIRAEMDDPDVALTGQFGHCSQELLNLLLTGRAVSNVFDGSVPLGGTGSDDTTGLMLRGIPERACVGYLTQLEALHYCQVGSYYKSPMHPVWVVGSPSHFSVCFGLDPAMCEESSCQMLFQRVQRVFKAFDAHETGFMDISALAESLRQLGVSPEVLSSEYWMARLLGQLEIAGAGIVLWDEYWKVVSVLLYTGDLELALSGKYESACKGGAIAADDSSQHHVQGERPRSDSDLARELQAQFDSEDSVSRPDVVSVPCTRDTAAITPVAPASRQEEQSQSPPQEPATSHAVAEAEAASGSEESFDLYYYNGLSSSGSNGRRPQLTKCRVTVPKKVDFIGKSVPILETGTGGGYASPPLEEVIKTKWVGARIDWFGQQVPSID